jgi:hypothetical protein
MLHRSFWNVSLRTRALLGLSLCLAAPLVAQRALPRSHVVRGVLFDSVSNAPLAGAEVHLTWRDSAGVPHRTRTDFEGRYAFRGIPHGRYAVGFYHESLDVLGLEAPVQGVDLDADSIVQMNMSIPSGGVVRMLRCRPRGSGEDGTPLLAGIVRSGAGRRPVDGATLTISWSGVSAEPGKLGTVLNRASAVVSSTGMFSMCDLPAGVVLTLEARAAGFRDITGPVTIPASGVLRQDALLVDTSSARGPAEIRGRVLSERGQPVVSGRARISALGREVPITDGAFAMMDLPVGTWAMEMRAIGVEPRALLVQASAWRNTMLLVRVSEQAQRLDAVTITGRADLVIHVLDAVLARHRTASGSVFLVGSPQLRGAQRVTDLLSVARGFTVLSPTNVQARSTASGARCRKIGVYVNGVRAIEGIEALDATARPDQVLAVEAYPDVMSAPFEWRTADGTCAVVAMWTRR